MRVTAIAPATTANLGPGFDCLGAAVSVHLRVVVDDAAPGRWSYAGPDTDEAMPPPDLILAALHAGAGEAVEVGLEVQTDIPLGRGLGSSAAAIAAGLVAGCALAGRRADPAQLLELGLPMEGHPDNLAAALHGGLTLVVGAETMRFRPTDAVRPAFLVPREALSTAEARRALPAEVPMADAVANTARTAALVALLNGTVEPTPERLLACTEDRLHQPHRAPLMPATGEVLEGLRAAGVAAFISGAGPTVGCLLVDASAQAFREAVAGRDGWHVLEPDWDGRGARLEEW